MKWPDIFFPAKKTRSESELQESDSGSETPQSAPPPPADLQPPTVKPVPASLGTQVIPRIVPQISPQSPNQSAKAEPIKIAVGTSTRTLPAMHGVVLRPPVKITPPPSDPGAQPPSPPEPIKNIEQLMAEADPVRTLSQSGSVHMLKRLTPDSETNGLAPAGTPAKALPLKPEAVLPSPPPPTPNTVAQSITPPPFPAFPPSPNSPALEIRKIAPTPISVPPSISTVDLEASSNDDESPFILKPSAASTDTPKVTSPSVSAPTAFGSIFRRKAKMADVARIVLPPRREETQPLPPLTDSSPTVVPPAFPVAAMTARATKPAMEKIEPISSSAAPVVENPFLQKSPSPSSVVEAPPPHDVRRIDPETPIVTENTRPSTDPMPLAEEKAATTESATPQFSKVDFEAPKPASQSSTPPPFIEEKPPAFSPAIVGESPKIDPEAHKAEPSAAPMPKIDPEAHRPSPIPAPPIPSTALAPSSAPAEKREFHLANGERVAGVVLSETPEAVYIEHATLGVLTIPRAQIAKRLVEIILINGDRIVGDIMAETADTLYVRHASLGMLTVPRAQRSTRVVEAILKDGDRILGEVLTETDSFTVIRSATLGTITVPHSNVSMLNRKIEQIELKSLPLPAPELKDKTAA